MFVPFISTPSSKWRSAERNSEAQSEDYNQSLEKRQFGAGRGGGSSGNIGTGNRESATLRFGGRSLNVDALGEGTVETFTIPEGERFAGRVMGGAVRGQIYGSRAYGSGYPGVSGKGTAGRDFPFYFWPITFGTGSSPQYVFESEYGTTSEDTRPGGRLTTLTLAGASGGATFRVVSDQITVDILTPKIQESCSTFLSGEPAKADFEGGSSSRPQPDEVIQYYRASSIALSLDGYENAAVASTDESTRDTALPTVNTEFLTCLNSTIGTFSPLVTALGPAPSNTDTSPRIIVTPAGSGALSTAPDLGGLGALSLLLLTLFAMF